MKRAAIAILASGSGSTAEAFIRSAQTQDYPLDVRLVICNNPDAFVFERIKHLNSELNLNINSVVVNGHTQAAKRPPLHGQQTDEEQMAILELLEKHKIDCVLLLGYMKRVGAQLISRYGWLPEYTSIYQCRMFNSHPGLLPQTIGTHGLGTQEYTLAQGMTEAGQTLHAVAHEYDTGPTVAEHRVTVDPGDTAETLFARVQAVEKERIAADVMTFIEAREDYLQKHSTSSKQ